MKTAKDWPEWYKSFCKRLDVFRPIRYKDEAMGNTPNIIEFNKEVREEFVKRLRQKTGWGRNEVIKEYDFAVELVIVKTAERYMDK